MDRNYSKYKTLEPGALKEREMGARLDTDFGSLGVSERLFESAPVIYGASQFGLDGGSRSVFEAPSLVRGFDGIGITEHRAYVGFNRVPPDHNGAVGEDHVVSVLNHVMQIYDKQGTLISTQTLEALFGVVPGANVLPVDPNIMYDPHSGRFIFVSFEVAGTTNGPINTADDRSFLNIAVSKTGDPTDGWHVTSIDAKTVIGGENTWIDFPGIAVDGAAIYITGNMFQFDGGPDGQRSFAGNRLWIIEKGEGSGGIYDGGAVASAVFDPVGSAVDLTGLGVSTATLIPARIEGALPGQSGIHLVAQSGLSNGVQELLQIISVQNPLSAPTFTAQSIQLGDISNENLNFLPNAPQPGGPQPISVVGARVLSGGAVWRDGKLYVAFTVSPKSGPDAGQSTVHWVELDTSNPSNIVLLQQGNIGGEDIAPQTSTFDASVNVNKDGSVLINFSAAGPSVFAGAYYAIRAADDPVGEFGPTQTLHDGLDYYFRNRAGEGISTQTTNRWGDFSGTAVDPADDTTFWIFNQYADLRGSPNASGQDGRWRVVIGSAIPTIENFEYSAGDANEEFFGGLGVDGLLLNADPAGSVLNLSPAASGAVAVAFSGVATSASARNIEIIAFEGAAGADQLTVTGDFGGVEYDVDEWRARGNGGADVLSAAGLLSPTNVAFSGGAGDDLLGGGGGDDTLDGGSGADTLNGGSGFDTASYADAGAGVAVQLSSGLGTIGDAAGDMLTGIEAIVGSAFDDTIDGGSGADSLSGNLGADLVRGDVGEDTLDGGAGADTLQGGAGFDTASYANANARVIAALWNGLGTAGEAAGDVLSGIEALIGSAFNDKLTGSGAGDMLSGGEGADRLWASAGNDTLAGDAGDDLLKGQAGDDLLDGGKGADTIDGGAGFDTASYTNAGAGVRLALWNGLGVVGEAAGDVLSGIEAVIGSAFADTITGAGGSDLLDGGGAGDRIWASGGDDTLIGRRGNDLLKGQGGDDLLNGGKGRDILDGGAGFDTAQYADASGGVHVELWSGLGVIGEANGDQLLQIEAVIGSNFNDKLTGNGSANMLDGSGGHDRLWASAGDDTLEGGNGNDLLKGQGGDDVMNGGAGLDTLDGAAGDDTFRFQLGGGADQFIGFVAGAATEDQIELIGFGPTFDSFAEVIAAAMQVGADTVIDFGAGDVITLENTTLAALHADDFLFG